MLPASGVDDGETLDDEDDDKGCTLSVDDAELVDATVDSGSTLNASRMRDLISTSFEATGAATLPTRASP